MANGYTTMACTSAHATRKKYGEWDLDLASGIIKNTRMTIYETSQTNGYYPTSLILRGTSTRNFNDKCIKNLVDTINSPDCTLTSVQLEQCIPQTVLDALKTKTLVSYIGKDLIRHLRDTKFGFPSSIVILDLSSTDQSPVDTESLKNAESLQTLKLESMRLPGQIKMKFNDILTYVTFNKVDGLTIVPPWFGMPDCDTSTYIIQNCPDIQNFDTNFWVGRMAGIITLDVTRSPTFRLQTAEQTTPFNSFTMIGNRERAFPSNFCMLAKTITLLDSVNVTLWDLSNNARLQELTVLSSNNEKGALIAMPTGLHNLHNLQRIHIQSATGGFKYSGTATAVDAAKQNSEGFQDSANFFQIPSGLKGAQLDGRVFNQVFAGFNGLPTPTFESMPD